MANINGYHLDEAEIAECYADSLESCVADVALRGEYHHADGYAEGWRAIRVSDEDAQEDYCELRLPDLEDPSADRLRELIVQELDRRFEATFDRQLADAQQLRASRCRERLGLSADELSALYTLCPVGGYTAQGVEADLRQRHNLPEDGSIIDALEAAGLIDEIDAALLVEC